MRKHNGSRLYSATDLVAFLECKHSTNLDIQHLTSPLEPIADDDEQTKLLQEKGIEHERAFLEELRSKGKTIVEIPHGDLEKQIEQTRAAMKSGPDVVYQGALFQAPWHGYSDFLLRSDAYTSSLGSYVYEVADTKLSRSAKAKHAIQLCVYADLVFPEQNAYPPSLYIVLGTSELVSFRTSSIQHYYSFAKARFEAYAEAPPEDSTGEPCSYCGLCRWREKCESDWEKADHLSRVANISKSQIAKLNAAGVTTMRQLSELEQGVRIPGLQKEAQERLVSQAALQIKKMDTEESGYEILPLQNEKGFNRLPKPNEGDLFFDMEGDPLYEGGIEYLFGIVHLRNNATEFTAFWAHDREAEKRAFEQCIDFMTSRIAAFPGAHIYHYASYEETALKRLAMYHGTREKEVDDILRSKILVDLYKVVRDAIRTSEPGYSIKNLETFYLEGKREGDVKTAGDSIVVYEKWRRLKDDCLLTEISAYNELDCVSTLKCRDWLLSLRPDSAVWYVSNFEIERDPEKEKVRKEIEVRTAQYVEALTADSASPDWKALLANLLEFHRREDKPSWWAMFSRQEMDFEQLLDDSECIAGLQNELGHPPRQDKKSKVFTFTFPPQDYKIRLGDTPLRADNGLPAGEVVGIDEDSSRIELKLGPTKELIPDGCSIIPSGPINNKVLREAIYRVADAVIAGNDIYRSVVDILRRAPPRFHSIKEGAAIVSDDVAVLEATVSALQDLDESYLLIQGPPGAGKTYTCSHAIISLLNQGKKIGVASNSHKAINNILVGVENLAQDRGYKFKGIKKSSKEDQFLNGTGLIEDSTASQLDPDGYDLIAGTAWLFARPEFDQKLDYLFVDEAGQVSLANIVAMGVSAKNLILVGDQMQLSQPIQGVHPGKSGQSALEFLLGDMSTVPRERGIFLPTTRRMHPALCGFISAAVYDGRLKADEATEKQRINTGSHDDPALAENGLRFIDVHHTGCEQKSQAEADRILQTYQNLLELSWVDETGEERQIANDDILVVTPYNMQVDILRSTLPDGARIGTVDKFQGQEAAVVLVSMVTSSGEDIPRNIEFLFSRNRLNVAISRARCLAVIFANPALLATPCKTIAQMELVNTLCWAKNYANQ